MIVKLDFAPLLLWLRKHNPQLFRQCLISILISILFCVIGFIYLDLFMSIQLDRFDIITLFLFVFILYGFIVIVASIILKFMLIRMKRSE